MKHLILAASMLAAAVPAMAADVAMSISVGDPNFYGRIDIGNFPQPQLINAQPIIIHRPAHVVVGSPLYLRVPPGHIKKWSKHCGKYNACGQQVYFVQDSWYSNVYVPQHRASHGKGHGDQGKGHGDSDKGHGDQGKGHGKDHGNGKGNGNGKN